MQWNRISNAKNVMHGITCTYASALLPQVSDAMLLHATARHARASQKLAQHDILLLPVLGQYLTDMKIF